MTADAKLLSVPATISEDEADVLGMPVSFYERAVAFGSRLTNPQPYTPPPYVGTRLQDAINATYHHSSPACAYNPSDSVMRRQAAEDILREFISGSR